MHPTTDSRIDDHLRELIERYEKTLTQLTPSTTQSPVDFANRHLTPGSVSALLVHPRNHDALLWGIVDTHLNIAEENKANILINTSFREPHETLEHPVTVQSRHDLNIASGIPPSKKQLMSLKTAAQHIKQFPISLSGNIDSCSRHIVELFEVFHSQTPSLVLLELSLIKSDLSNYPISDIPELLDSYQSLAQRHDAPIILVIKCDKPSGEAHLNAARATSHARTIARVLPQAIPPSHKIQGPPVNSLTSLSYASSETGHAPLTY
jgi:hypothetical protein